MFSFHSKYFVYRELKRAPEKLSFCFKCPDTGTVRILGNILYSISCVKCNYRVCRLNEEKECFSFSCDVMFEINLYFKLLWRHLKGQMILMNLS